MTNEQKLREALQAARGAINSLSEASLGYVQYEGSFWPVKAELLEQIDQALSPQPPTSDEGTPKTTRDVLVDDLIAAKMPKQAETPYTPAAFINAIADEGSKAEAVEWLQKIWNEKCQLERTLHAKERELDSEINNHQGTIESWKKESKLLTEENDQLKRELVTLQNLVRENIYGQGKSTTK